jgi:glycosyltransferase involved in cell wall biosynthesis
MKIGVDVTCWSNKRGYGRFTRELLRAIAELDRSNEYFFFIDQDSSKNADLPCTARRVVVSTKEVPTAAAADGRRRNISDIWAMSRAVMCHRLDIFFFPTMYSFFPIFNRSKVVVTLHDMIANNYPELTFSNDRSKYFWKLKQRAAIKQASLIATVSEYSKSQISSYFRIPASRLRVISEAADPIFASVTTNSSEGILRKFGLSSTEAYLLYVGGISPHKNLSTLIDGFKKIQAEYDADVKLVLVGDHKDDPFLSAYPSLKQQIERLGLDSHVVFTGFVPDDELVHLYSSAALLVFPSLDEGFGLPAVEAMSCGTPVAASNRGSLPEVLGEAGAYFDPLDPAAIAAVVGSLLKDAGKRGEMRNLGIARSSKFKWTRSAEQTLAIFDELSNGKSA